MKTIFSALLACLITSTISHAGTIQHTEWLSLQQTWWYSWDDMDAIFDTNTGRCDVSDCTLRSTAWSDKSIDMTGYVWASNKDVNKLWKSYTQGPGLSSLSAPNETRVTDNQGATELLTLLGRTDGSDPLFSFSMGTTRNIEPGGYAYLITIGDTYYPPAYNATPTDFISLGYTSRNSFSTSFGGFFYRPLDVAEPSILSVISIIFASLTFLRRKRVQS